MERGEKLPGTDRGGGELVDAKDGEGVEEARYRADGRVKIREWSGGSGMRMEDPAGVDRAPLPPGEQQGGL